MTRTVELAVTRAWKLAEDFDEGKIILQLDTDNKNIRVYHVLGNNWDSLGLNAQESQDRILYTFDCRYYDRQYIFGDKRTKKNRLSPREQDEFEFLNIVGQVKEEIARVKNFEKDRTIKA